MSRRLVEEQKLVDETIMDLKARCLATPLEWRWQEAVRKLQVISALNAQREAEEEARNSLSLLEQIDPKRPRHD